MLPAIEIEPTVIVPDKSFLIGALYGFNAARKRMEENPKPLIDGQEVDENLSDQPVYLGCWFEVTCPRCGALYTFDNPNQLPFQDLICPIKGCGNHVIHYGVLDTRLWRIGNIVF